jgi:hypothetical protein
MPEITYSAEFHEFSVTVRINWRLQHWRTDASLFANKDFETPKEGTSLLLEAILTLLRRNDAGFDTIRVSPYAIEFQNGTPDAYERVIALMKKAGLVAHMSLRQVSF